LISIFILLKKDKHTGRYIVYGKLPDNLKAIVKMIISNKDNSMRISNDYKVKFLPETQFLKLEFKKINLENLVPKQIDLHYYFKTQSKQFYIENLQDDLLITLSDAKFFYLNIKELLNSNSTLKFKSIKSNLNPYRILDTELVNDKIYVSAKIDSEDKNTYTGRCQKFQIYKGNFNYDYIDFTKIYEDPICYGSVQGGKMEYYKEFQSIAISTAADIVRSRRDTSISIYVPTEPQDDKSYMGKVLLLNEKTNEIKIFSKGHRNILGLVSYKDKLIATEMGPEGGDEINLLEMNGNYGWPIASEGEPYDLFDENKEYFYKKSHSKLGFKEPIFSFVPSIGISDIIKVDQSFSEVWKDSFLIASLNGLQIYRTIFDEKYSKIKILEKIHIGERIRGLKYNKKFNVIFLVLESTGSLGVLVNK
jgi:hypothetical protein